MKVEVGERARERGPVRCPYCRDDVAQPEAVECPGCRTLLHAECAASVPRCPTVGCAGRTVAMERASGPLVFALNHLGKSRLAVALWLVWMPALYVTLVVASEHLSNRPRERIIDSAPEGSRVPWIEREVPRWPPAWYGWTSFAVGAASLAGHAALVRAAWRRVDRPG